MAPVRTGRRTLFVAFSAFVVACSDDGHVLAEGRGSGGSTGSHSPDAGEAAGHGGQSSDAAGAGAAGTDAMRGAGGTTCTKSSSTETSCSGSADDDCDGLVGCLDPDCEGKACGSGVTCVAGACLGKSPLPELPLFDNLAVTVRGDTAIVDFSPVLGAKDYRVYRLPADGDVLVGSNKDVVVRNAVYRCGGALPREDRSTNAMKPLFSLSLAGNVEGFQRNEADATLGYVFITPGPGRTPVYRVANPNSIGGYTWEYDAPPTKEYNGAEYVEGTPARDELVAQGWRDDRLSF
jgi:hypothetical protein